MVDNVTNEPKCLHYKTWTCNGLESPLCSECVVTFLKQRYAQGEITYKENKND